jgi:ABC-type spermidine/putrescine transport system permease subunit II
VAIQAFRYGFPAVILVVGIVLVIIGGDAPLGAGIVLIGVALLVFVFNLFARMAVASQDDREREEAAREYYAEHGRWPRPKR